MPKGRGRINKRSKKYLLTRLNARLGHFPRGKRYNMTAPVGKFSGVGIPQKLLMKHRYCDNFAISTLAAGAMNIIQFTCNNLFDPLQTGSGHQPMYYDQIAALYNHWCVIGSKITVRISPAAANQVPAVVGLYVEDDATITPTLFGCLENAQATHKVLSFNANNPITLSKKWSAKKVFGKGVLANTDLQGTASVGPVERSYFTIFVDSSAAVTATSFNLDIQMEFIVVWKELTAIGTS